MSRLAAWVILVLLLASFGLQASAIGTLPHVGQEEIDTGKEAAADVEKDRKILDDQEITARVQTIGEAIAAVANSLTVEATYGSATIVPFAYTFKVIDDDDVNAFSIPGGHIYIHKGLIDRCESDHELAGVIAHEVAHAAHHHMVYLLRKQSRLEGRMALIMVAGLLGNVESRDMSNIMMGSQFYKTARISGYGQKAETDADLTAFTYLTHANYNPVGMLTFLERLATQPDVIDWGIFRTHPRAGERVATVKERLSELGIEINRRAVTTSSTAVARPVGELYEIAVGETLICRLQEEARAVDVAERINSLLDRGLQLYELRCDGSSVLVSGEPLIEITDADADLANESREELASDVCNRLRQVLFKQLVRELW